MHIKRNLVRNDKTGSANWKLHWSSLTAARRVILNQGVMVSTNIATETKTKGSLSSASGSSDDEDSGSGSDSN